MAIVALPFAIERLLPNNREAIEYAAVFAPTVAFCFRYVAGKRQIALNQCSGRVRKFQFVVFCCGVMPLAMIECVITLMHVMPKPREFWEIAIVFGVLLAIYLLAMIIAMYPGRTQQEVISQ